MKITKIVPPTNGRTLWHGEAISPRQHYRWFVYPGERCKVQSGKLSDGPVVSSNGTKYSRLYANLRRAPPALAREVAAALRNAG